MGEKFNEFEWPENKRQPFSYLRVSSEGQLERAVAYLRTNARGLERAVALIEQQNALQRFADAAGYRVVRWFVEGENVELDGSALDQLIDAVAAGGRDFNAVLIWNHSRVSRSAVQLSELVRTLEAHGVELVSASDHTRCAGLERQLAELNGAPDDEVAG